MNDERFDSWLGFVKAGFAPAGKGALQLGKGDVFCRVVRKGGALAVRFKMGERDGSEFNLPDETEDFWHWAALLAREAVGSRERWEKLQRQIGRAIPEELAQVIDLGLNHLDELPERKPEKEKPMREESIDEAMDRVRRRLEATREAFWERLQAETREKNLDAVCELSEKLRGVEALMGELDEIGELVAKGGEPSEPRPRPAMVLPKEPTGPKGHRTNFAVTFANGTRITGDTAAKTFALVIEKMGPERVAELGLTFGGDPIVTRRREEIRKLPREVLPIVHGEWFVKTHSSTDAKMKKIKEAAEALGLSLAFEWFSCQAADNSRKGQPRRSGVR